MKNTKQTIGIKLNKEQLETMLVSCLSTKEGLNQLTEALVNALMICERNSFLLHENSEPNKANGFRPVFKAGAGAALELKIPRDRLGLFKPVILTVLAQQEEKIKELSFALYGKGLTTSQISDVLTSIYGKDYSKSTISQITVEFSGMVEDWLNRRLDAYYPVIYIDALYLKVKRETVSNEAYYVILGVKEDYSREIMGVVNFPTESASGWQETLEGLRKRGVKRVGLVVYDDLSGLFESISKVYKKSLHQKCIIHFQRSMSRHIRVKDRRDFCRELSSIFDPDNKSYTIEKGVIKLRTFLLKWSSKYPSLKKVAERGDLSNIFTYLRYDYRVRRMLYTTNWIERFNKSVKRTTRMRNSFQNPRSGLILVGYVAMEMGEKTYKHPISLFKLEDKFIENVKS